MSPLLKTSSFSLWQEIFYNHLLISASMFWCFIPRGKTADLVPNQVYIVLAIKKSGSKTYMLLVLEKEET